MSTAETPIMVRAAISRDEWTQLRKIALDQNRSVQNLVADALRTVYPNLTSQEDTRK